VVEVTVGAPSGRPHEANQPNVPGQGRLA
jgi:hypothetical protein